MTPSTGRRRALLALFAAGAPAWVAAQQVPAPTLTTPVALAGLPTEVRQALPGARLAGQARLQVWGFQIYDARLWTAPGFKAAAFGSQPLALELLYLRDFDAVSIAERSVKEMRRSATISADQERAWLAEMQRVFPDVKKGDRLLGVLRPGAAAVFWLNGQPRGEIRDAEFARLFFGIWLSLKTSEPAMREALLAGADS